MDAIVTAQQYKKKYGNEALIEAKKNYNRSLTKSAEKHWEDVIQAIKNL